MRCINPASWAYVVASVVIAVMSTAAWLLVFLFGGVLVYTSGWKPDGVFDPLLFYKCLPLLSFTGVVLAITARRFSPRSARACGLFAVAVSALPGLIVLALALPDIWRAL